MHSFTSLTEKSGDLIQPSKRPGNKYSPVTSPNPGFGSGKEDEPMYRLESRQYSNRDEAINTGRTGRLESFE